MSFWESMAMRNRETPGQDSTRRKDGGVSCTEGEQVLQLVHQPFSCFIKCLEAQVNQIILQWFCLSLQNLFHPDELLWGIFLPQKIASMRN